MITLYKKNSFGIGRWSIWAEGGIVKFGHSASLDGHLTINEEVIEFGKGGRSLDEQIGSRIHSRTSKMLDKGYKTSVEEAIKGVTNQLGLVSPMLAQTLKATEIMRKIIQPKLNGHRCMITCHNGEIVAYSKQGKPITTIEHILTEFRGRIAEGDTVDGEVYMHGLKLQDIASRVKRSQPTTKNLVYYAFDHISADDKTLPTIDRLRKLHKLMVGTSDPVYFTTSRVVNSLSEAQHWYESHLREGFEGSMLRDPSSQYQPGKRSASILKMKPKFDTEVEVIDIVPSETGFGLCVCKLAGLDYTFKVLAPGTHDDRFEALKNKNNYIGRLLKIEYRELTSDGIPFHAVATEWFSSI